MFSAGYARAIWRSIIQNGIEKDCRDRTGRNRGDCRSRQPTRHGQRSRPATCEDGPTRLLYALAVHVTALIDSLPLILIRDLCRANAFILASTLLGVKGEFR